jgi:uncharacterized membrane protein AbrB (regulator of aidB expression)
MTAYEHPASTVASARLVRVIFAEILLVLFAIYAPTMRKFDDAREP